MSKFVSDKFFERKNYGLKFFQTVLTLGMWCLVVIPVVITLNSIYFKIDSLQSIQWKYLEGVLMYNSVIIFLFKAFVFFIIIALMLTFNNNYNVKYRYKKSITYNSKELSRKKRIMNQVYTERFGIEEVRLNVKYYSIDEDKNFDTHYIKNIYLREGEL